MRHHCSCSLLSVQTLHSVSCLDSDDTVCPAECLMESGRDLQGPSSWLSAWPKCLLWWVGGKKGEMQQAQPELLAEALPVSLSIRGPWPRGDAGT